MPQSATTITHPLHCYPLQLLVNPPANYKGECCCMFCLNICHGFAYKCSHCNLILDIKCATSPKFKDPISFTHLKHFIHEHELVFFDNHTDEGDKFMCIRCQEGLSGPIYCCLECQCPFRIHSKCLDEIPEQINHPCHRKHPLRLLPYSFDVQSGRSCDVCQNSCVYDLTYSCRFCDFDVHATCRHLASTVDSEIHQHSLSLLLRKCQFLCRGCGKEASCAPYVCTTCPNLVLHKDCVSLPHRVKVIQHHHVLYHNLYISRQESEKAECQICHKELNPNLGSYSCALECGYVVHVHCATDIKFWDRSVGQEKCLETHKQQPDQGTSLSHELSSVLASASTQSKHSHDWISEDEIPNDDMLHCYACFLPILAGSKFYKCSPCDLFLHSHCDCALLPQVFKHWDHHHPFVLVPDERLFICGVCKYPCTGFSYTCVECDLSVCLRCKQIIAQDKCTSHKGHEHTLFFDKDYNERPCRACGNLCGKSSRDAVCLPAWRCRDCDFAVDSRCLTLPEKARHAHDEHPLTLNFPDNESDPRCCYCDICEKVRDPKHWFYSCEQGCNFKAHSKCVLGKYPFMRIGHEFNNNIHEHTLQLFRHDDFPECDMCRSIIDDIALKCKESECNYTIHWECLFLHHGLRFTPVALS